jgi:hypothetical protein
MPSEFAKYFDYVKKLTFKETPDYDYLNNLFFKIYQKNGFTPEKKFDWSDSGTAITNDTHNGKKSRMDSKL